MAEAEVDAWGWECESGSGQGSPCALASSMRLRYLRWRKDIPSTISCDLLQISKVVTAYLFGGPLLLGT